MPGCCCGECCNCLRLSISGVVSISGCFCPYCTVINGSYNVQAYTSGGVTATCNWKTLICDEDKPYGTCLTNILTARLYEDEDGDWIFNAGFGNAPGTRMLWQHNFGSERPSCVQIAAASPIEPFETEAETEEDEYKLCDISDSIMTVEVPSTGEDCEGGVGCDARPANCTTNCIDNFSPNALQVKIPASWTNGIFCTGCNANLSGTIILDFVSQCTYKYTTGGTQPGTGLPQYEILARFNPIGFSGYLVIDAIARCTGPNSSLTRWLYKLPDVCEKFNCSLEEALDEDGVEAYFCCDTASESGFGVARRCKWDGITATFPPGGDPDICTGATTCPGVAQNRDSIKVKALAA